MSRIAVLMTCYNRREKTLDCLRNVERWKVSSDNSIDIYLVDDGSTDGTSAAVLEQYPSVNLIEGNGALYWNRGMLKAWSVAKSGYDYDYYLWLNDDTNLFEYALDELLECSQNIQNNGIVCGAVSSLISGEFTYGGRDQSGKPIFPNGQVTECSTINGNCVLVPKGVSDVIGLLDPIFPHAIGDYEYGLRAVRYGFKLVTTTRYVGHCEKNASLPKWCYRKYPIRERIRTLYSPLGNSHPKYFFIFERRYYGLPRAIKHYLSVHLRMLMPELWK